MPVDPRPHSLRDVVEMATGRWDLELASRAFWASMLGAPLKPNDLLEMHPLRRLSKPRPTPKTAEQKARESGQAWGLIFHHFGGTYQPAEQTGPTPVSGG